MGVVFLVIGILGFFNNPVIGVFSVNSLHNWVHIVSGVLALIFAYQSSGAARGFAIVFGIVYALVAILGWTSPSFMQDLISVNTADNYLHVVLALLFFWIGSMKDRTMQQAMPS